MERALREGRERAHRLDLVAEELHAKRLAARGREDGDEAAAHRELPAIVHLLHALLPRERERLHQPVDAWLETRPQLDRRGARRRRRPPLRALPAPCATQP